MSHRHPLSYATLEPWSPTTSPDARLRSMYFLWLAAWAALHAAQRHPRFPYPLVVPCRGSSTGRGGRGLVTS